MNNLYVYYRKHKYKVIPLFFILISFIVVFRVTLPQWNDIQETYRSLKNKEDIVNAKESTVSLLNSIPQNTVDDYYQLATRALPKNKDLILIFTELSNAAEKTGVVLGSMSVKVGDIYAQDNQTDKTKSNISGIPYLNTTINVDGSGVQIKQFSEFLNKSLPLIEINKVDIQKGTGNIDVNLYFKPSVKVVTSDSFQKLEKISNEQLGQIQELKTWNSAPVSPLPF